MNDQEMLEQFEKASLPKDQFTHRNHLRLAWIYLSRYSLEEARSKLTNAILHYARHQGAAHIYNETLTCFWFYRVKQAMSAKDLDFDEFLTQNAFLLDKNLPLSYYSQTRLESELAKKTWLEPDLQSLAWK